MSTIYLVVRLDDQNDAIIEHISAHPTKQSALSAERFYRHNLPPFSGVRTDIIEVAFEA